MLIYVNIFQVRKMAIAGSHMKNSVKKVECNIHHFGGDSGRHSPAACRRESVRSAGVCGAVWLHGTDLSCGLDHICQVSLCNTSYYDLPNAPISAFGFVSNGNVRALYSEEYYSNGGGNYYSYYFASFDFGKTRGDVLSFIREFCLEGENNADDELPREISKGNILKNRRISCPNTYGVSDLNASETCELLLNYDWFNSMQLRNRYHDTASLFEDIQ